MTDERKPSLSVQPLSSQILEALRRALVGEGIPGVVWYAKGGGLQKSGPYATPHKAAEMFRLRATGLPPDDFCYWPEPASKTPASKPTPKGKPVLPAPVAPVAPVPPVPPVLTRNFNKLPLGVPVDERGYAVVAGVSQTIAHYAKPGSTRTLCGYNFQPSIRAESAKRPLTKRSVTGEDGVLVPDDGGRKLCSRCVELRKIELARAEKYAAALEQYKKLFVIFDEDQDEYLAWVSDDGCWLKVSDTLGSAAQYGTCTEAEAVIDRLVMAALSKQDEGAAQRHAALIIETVADSMKRFRRPPN